MSLMKIFGAAIFVFGISACAGSNENAGQIQSNGTVSAKAAPSVTDEIGSLGLKVGETINLAGMGTCRVVQADGVELYKGNITRNDCIAKCATYEDTNPGRSCSHNSGFLRVAPRQACQIVGAAGVVHYYALAGRMRCAQECNKYGNPNRQCLWGGVSVKP